MSKTPAKGRDTILKKKIRRWILQAREKMICRAWTAPTFYWDYKSKSPMGVTCDADYRRIEVYVNLKLCKTYSSNRLRFECYHEMGHVLLGEYTALAESRKASLKQLYQAEEQLVELIARIALGE